MYKIKNKVLEDYIENDEAIEVMVGKTTLISIEDVDIIIERIVKNINNDAVLVTDACLHPMQSRVMTHRGCHCGDCGKRF